MRTVRATASSRAAALAVSLLCGCAPGSRDLPRADPEALIRQASFLLVPPRCAGVVAGDAGHGLTAAHCVHGEGEPLTVQLASGEQLDGAVAALDPAQDLALIRFNRDAPVVALEIARELPRPGEGLLFVGRADRPAPAQHLWLRKLGRCPSLPAVPNALFTTLQGHKGDSGSPIVDGRLRVVGLVHGGAACNVAAPTLGAAALLRASADTRVARRAVPAHPAPAAVLRLR